MPKILGQDTSDSKVTEASAAAAGMISASSTDEFKTESSADGGAASAVDTDPKSEPPLESDAKKASASGAGTSRVAFYSSGPLVKLSRDDKREIIRLLSNAAQDRTVECNLAPFLADRRDIRNKLILYLNIVIKELAPGCDYRIDTSHIDNNSLVKRALSIFVYRAIQGKLFSVDDYLTFFKTSRLCELALQQQNPFFLKEHLVKLFNAITSIKDMVLGTQRCYPEEVARLPEYLDALKTLMQFIDDVPNSIYKHFLAAFCHLTIAYGYSIPGSDLYDVTKVFSNMMIAYSHASIGEEDKATVTEAEAESINFFTFGRGLFHNVVVDSFAHFKSEAARQYSKTPCEFEEMIESTIRFFSSTRTHVEGATETPAAASSSLSFH